MLSNLDIDVILQILAWLDAEDILALRKTSKQFCSLTHLRPVWHNALSNLLADNIPLARVQLGPYYDGSQSVLHDFSPLSDLDLERLVLATYRTSEVWQRPRPERTRAIRMRAREARVFMLRFLRIRSTCTEIQEDKDANEGRYLVSFGHTAIPTLCMEVWDVDATREGQDRERLAAEWGVNGRVIGMAVDEGNGLREWAMENSVKKEVKGSVIAVSTRDFNVPGAVVFFVRILIFTPSIMIERSLGLLKLFRLPGPLNIRELCGRLIAVQVRADGEGQVFGHGVLKVVDWVRSTEIYAQGSGDAVVSDTGISDTGREFAVKLEPSIHGANRAVLRVHFAHDWVLVFRESVLEMYFLPPSSLTNRPRTIWPDAFHKWNWQVNSIVVTERASWAHDRMSMRCRWCEGQGVVPSSVDDKVRSINIVCACRYRPLSIVARFDSYYPWPVNLLHHFVLHINPQQAPFDLAFPIPPYKLPPALTHTVPSTIRLFGHSVLVLGRFGTVLWTDSEANSVEGADAYFAEGNGERVAGRILRLPPCPEHTTPAGIVASHQQETDPNVVETLPSSVPEGTSEQPIKPSVFATRLAAGWYSVALSESRGRIAIGDGEGVIEVWDHF